MPWTKDPSQALRDRRLQLLVPARDGVSPTPVLGADDDLQLAPSQSFSVTLQGAPPGLVGTVGVRIVTVTDPPVTVSPRATTNVVELVAGSGIYAATNLIAPAAAGRYVVIADDGASDFGGQDFEVVSDPSPPPSVAPGSGDPAGPCQRWIDGQMLHDSNAIFTTLGITVAQLEDYATEASEIMYEMSGRRFQGVCSASARPVRQACQCWGLQTLAGGHVIDTSQVGFGYWDGRWWRDGGNDTAGGCGATTSVKLPGYPVREITKITIDGETIDPSLYRLDRGYMVTALQASPSSDVLAFPQCQNMSLSDIDGPGRFIISYTWGEDPPLLGRGAAIELGQQLALAVLNDDTCRIPVGTVSITRQGVTINRAVLSGWITGQTTGLVNTDAFIGIYNQTRRRRRPSVWSPDISGYARRIGG